MPCRKTPPARPARPARWTKAANTMIHIDDLHKRFVVPGTGAFKRRSG